MNTFDDFKEEFKERALRAKARGIDTKTLYMLERFESAIARDPNDANAYTEMGDWWYSQRDYRKALDHLETAVQLDGKFASALCIRASLFATCPDAGFRDGTRAVHDAEAAISIAGNLGELRRDWRHRSYLRVLAASYAERGDFPPAIGTLEEALTMTITKSATRELAGDLESYRRKQPIRAEKGIVHHNLRRGT